MVKTMFDRKALAEVYEVIIMLDKNDYNKIPKDILNAIKLNKDNDYDINFDEIENGNMLPDTIKILSSIYTYYLANDEEKNVIFNLININRDNNKHADESFSFSKEDKESDLPIVSEDNFIIKILNKIKKFFKFK